jgi:hypothetical protein
MKVLNPKSLDDKLRHDAIPAPLANEIREYLLSASDAELYSMNPYRFASRRKLDRTSALRAFLHLTKSGLFNLYWNIHCPACKGVTQHSNSLITLKHSDTCGICTTKFEAGFDSSIEVSFGVNPAIIKPADMEDFEKIVATFDMEPGVNIELEQGESHYLKQDFREGNYFLFVNGAKKALNIVVTAGRADRPRR